MSPECAPETGVTPSPSPRQLETGRDGLRQAGNAAGPGSRNGSRSQSMMTVIGRPEAEAEQCDRGSKQGFMTWNLGGMKREKLTEILDTLPGLGLGEVGLVAFQEVNMDPGVHYGKEEKGSDEWIVAAGKQDGEWRGRAIAVKKQVGVIRRRKVGRNGLGLTVATAEGHVGILNVHLPQIHPQRYREATGGLQDDASSKGAQAGSVGGPE